MEHHIKRHEDILKGLSICEEFQLGSMSYGPYDKGEQIQESSRCRLDYVDFYNEKLILFLFLETCTMRKDKHSTNFMPCTKCAAFIFF